MTVRNRMRWSARRSMWLSILLSIQACGRPHAADDVSHANANALAGRAVVPASGSGGRVGGGAGAQAAAAGRAGFPSNQAGSRAGAAGVRNEAGSAGALVPGGSGGSGGVASVGGAGGISLQAGRGGSGGAGGSGGRAGGDPAGADAGGAPGAPRPCDIYAASSNACVAAHSTVRALFASYSQNLYQVRRNSDNTTRDIGVSAPGGSADAAAQDAFCANTNCVITIVYDQSGRGNHLEYQGEGSSVGGRDKPASATSESLNLDGRKVYSLYINPGNSYWRDGHTTGIPTGAAPEGLYMVTSGTHVNSGCCFDYGNSETTRSADGAGAMDAIYFGTSCWFGSCSGSGPWVQADLEFGLYPGGSQKWNSKQVAFTHKYVTAMLKNDGRSKFALKGANAQSGMLTTLWDGALPSGYSPMKKQGAIVLGSGGDCCARNTNQSLGTFYEGAIVLGYPTDATDALIQENIVAAGYGR